MPVDTKAFEKSLKRYDDKMSSALAKAMDTSIKKLEKEAKALAPYKSGELEENTSTETRKTSAGAEGGVTFDVPYAALRHNKLDSRPGPGTKGKNPTKYGTPGVNFLQNPSRGMGQDHTFSKEVDKEVRRLK